ncbi:MAG TPA: protein-L-isoaspartate(D-aspartate) O-methyltransferase [bacterium]
MPAKPENIFKEYEKSRFAMVEEQIASRGIKDIRILRAMEKVPRHFFIDSALLSQAYSDFPLPIGEGQTISQPYIVALMLEALELQGNEKILEIGTGSGYQTALLAELCKTVCTVERIPSLAEKAKQKMEVLGYKNVKYKIGDGSMGWEEEKPFDCVILSASAPELPKGLLPQLKTGGKLVSPVGNNFSQSLIKITRLENDQKIEDLGGCRFVKLIGKYGWTPEE